MIRVAFIVAVVACGSIQAKKKDNNDKWRPNDDIFKIMDPYYFQLQAEPTDSNKERKRFMSVLSLALAVYMKSNVTDDDQRIEESVAIARRELTKPTEAIGGVMRAILTVMRAIVDKPINDVKVSCPPSADQETCEEQLRYRHDRNEAACPGYSRNLDYHKWLLRLVHRPDTLAITKEMARTSKTSDDDALNYFVRLATGRHSKYIKEVRDTYQIQLLETVNCNVLNTPVF
ncbi:uncharacterized protein [Battus philenor]|uniref:uncharacterized protein n=1 Tax=Battus philenor TaxID=42288 RepID=UPI0035CFB168